MKPRYLVYLRASKGATADALARAIGASRADADRVLKARVPQPVDVVDSADLARERILALRSAGLDGLAITTQALARFAPIAVTAGTRDADGIAWHCADGEVRHLARGHARMIVVGRMRWEGRAEMRSGDDYGAASQAAELTFCCMFRDTDEALWFLERDFAVRSLVPGPVPPQSAQSIRAVVAAVRAAYPDALVDETLAKSAAPMRSVHAATSFAQEDGAEAERSVSVDSNERAMLQLAYILYLREFGAAPS